MSTMPYGCITLRDLARSYGNKATGDQALVQLAADEMPMMDDIQIRAADKGEVCETEYMTELPKAEFVGYYDGPLPSKMSSQVLRVTCGRIKSRLEIAAELLEEKGEKAQQKLLQNTRAHMTAIEQAIGGALVYGDVAVDARGFNGFFKLLNTCAGTTFTDDKKAAFYCLDGAKATSPTTTDRRSMLLVGWGDTSAFMFYPEGHGSGGITQSALKTEVAKNDDTGGKYDLNYKEFKMVCGLCIRDFRKMGRIANLSLADMAAAVSDAESKAEAMRYIQLIDRLTGRVDSRNVARQAWYMDKLTWERTRMLFSRLTMDNAIKKEDIDGRRSDTLYGVPVRINQAQNVNEDLVPTAA